MKDKNIFLKINQGNPKTGSRGGLRRQWLSGSCFSILIHLILISALTLFTLPSSPMIYEMIFQPTFEDSPSLRIAEQKIAESINISPDADMSKEILHAEPNTNVPEINISRVNEPESQKTVLNFDPAASSSVSVSDLMQVQQGGISRNDLSGRGRESKGTLIAQGGGNEGSERAVALALEWISRHQLSSGSWSFDHTLQTGCAEECGPVGKRSYHHDRRTGETLKQNDYFGATGMALLPFLGAGYTHKNGIYKNTVAKGLQFLVRNMQKTPDGGSLWDEGGQMYSHGLATTALCEAYAMTHDPNLKEPAQEAIRYIVNAQDPRGGGWRYRFQQPGDTSVFGWQFMALKSGSLGGLFVPRETIDKATFFLDKVVAYNDGSGYGYTNSRRRGEDSKATTSIGLLSQMYLGWERSHPALERGIDEISGYGPNPGNIYFSYYAALVLHHYGGEKWGIWNREMRDMLIKSQEQTGHKRGSWFLLHPDDVDKVIESGTEEEDGKDNTEEEAKKESKKQEEEVRQIQDELDTGRGHHDAGGRLYYTAMACMILEVYYRYLPLYRKSSTEIPFPFE
ncbi:MAG: terpene cyclase/mutase family protein [Planctomycetaceae bacterium]|jgi:hypothetical protein|nr:terpene cyclase/mutase family protein [Planctomycetaceae bacterium]